jgi:5'-AMP-activated protein kinase catalytic alpha subunit
MKDGIFLYSSCGSPNYAAPELINGKFYNGASIDIWSCGVILYTLLTGCLPFNEKQTNKLYQKIRECKYVLPENITDSAKDLIFRMLQKNPLDRITIPEIKQHKWFSNKLSLFQVIDNAKYIYGSRAQVDKEIIHQMAVSEKINTEKYTEEQIQEILKGKENKELSVIYDFLETQKNERLFKEKKEKLKSKSKFIKILYIIFIFIDDTNFFKRNKISTESEVVLSKLRDKMRKKLLDDEMNEESKNNDDSKDKNNDINEIRKNEELWRVGIICKKDCYYLTQEILKILEKNGYEWKIVSSSYKIKCRKKLSEAEQEKNEINSGLLQKQNSLNVLIQIFGDIDRHNKDEFLVDLHKLSGTVMEFLEFASTFVSCIQQEGLIVTK